MHEAPTELYPLSLHDALPISIHLQGSHAFLETDSEDFRDTRVLLDKLLESVGGNPRDRKSTRLNSSHLGISYAVFCLKKKKKNNSMRVTNNIDCDHPAQHHAS